MTEADLPDDAMTSLRCPSEGAILSFVDGSASAGDRARIEAHLGRCEVCRQLISALAPTSGPSAGATDVGAVTDAIRVGATLAGKYRVVRILGQGGMGVVVEAHHETLDRPVALKFLRKALADNAEAVGRFFREARAAAALDSDHVVRVLDAGHLPETHEPYLALEFLDGRDLAQLVGEGGPLSVVDAVDYVLQAAEALCLAHARGIVHRDIKPANLFLTHRPDGSALVKVLDFGIAKVLEGSSSSLGETSQSAILGSPRYMAPEQLKSSAGVDGRADVWALGVTLFELLTAALPFEGTSVPMLCSAILTAVPPPLRSLRPDAPPELEAVIARALMKNPADRIAGMDLLARELSPFASPEGKRMAERAERVSKRPAAHSTSDERAGAARAAPGSQSTLSNAASSKSGPPPAAAPKTARTKTLVVGVALLSAGAAASAMWLLQTPGAPDSPAAIATAAGGDAVVASGFDASAPAEVAATTPAPTAIEPAAISPRDAGAAILAMPHAKKPASGGAASAASAAPPPPAPPASPASSDPLHRDGLLDRK